MSPNGIVSFELAKDVSKSRAIINSWDETARTAAGMSLGLDFLFLVIYALFIAFIIRKLNERLWNGNSFYIIGKFLIVAILAAAFFDIVENIALIRQMLGDTNESWPLIAYFFALIKFILILCCIIYIIINALILLVKKPRT
jgi:uncharacterized membrane protein YraQ (UPF0718 family)